MKETIFDEIYKSSNNIDGDSREDTLDHKNKVKELIFSMISELFFRAEHHDDSKLDEPEKPLFDIYSPKLKDCTYGSNEYKEFLKNLKPALDHHYFVNSHHPEHYERGIDGMDLLDLIEMMADWKASTMRHNDGDINSSLKINKDRFNISDQLEHILQNTINKYLT